MATFCSGCLKQLPDDRHIELPGRRLVCFDSPLEYTEAVEVEVQQVVA